MDEDRLRAAASVQVGRKLRGCVKVVSLCHLGLPVSIEVSPLLDDGTPFPTRFWLTCPLAVSRVGRLEGMCRIHELSQRTRRDPNFARRLAEAHIAYARERDVHIPNGYLGPRPKGGIAGSASPCAIKCLHAHYAHFLAGYPNPVGEDVAPDVEPLDCELPCVVGTARNPLWREPHHPVSGPRKPAKRGSDEGCSGRHRNKLDTTSSG